jgi:hypothetical protein
MNCEICRKESQWLEIVGKNFCCYKCINKNKIMGLVLRTHADTFRYIIKKLEVKDYEHMMKLKKEDIIKVADLKKYNIL